MRNSDIFFYPGKIGARFVLSLFDLRADQVDPGVFWLISLIVALLFWLSLLRGFWAVLKKLLGFGRKY